jgi:hypothetical protein
MHTAQDPCFVRDGVIVLLRNGYVEYPVEADRCDTPEKILGWVVHLSAKPWFTTKHLQLFVKYAAEANGITIDYNG